MKTSYSGFFLKATALSLPALLLTLLYLISDPYKVLRHYHFDNYYNWQPNEINRDYISFENLSERIHKGDVPTDFIMGNSRSLAFHTDAWQKICPDVERPFHYDAASETLLGVYQKVNYLHQHRIPIRHVLLVADYTLLSKDKNQDDAVHIKHPAISGSSLYTFHGTFLKTFFSSFFCFKWIHYQLNGHRILSYMRDVFAIEPGYITTEAYTNNYYYTVYEKKLKEDSLHYYQEYKKAEFTERPQQQQVLSPALGAAHHYLLSEINRMVKADNGRFDLVISPLYDQKIMAPDDKAMLQQVFGENRVHDFSGINAITANKGNYYESSHYKPYVADSLMQVVYQRL
ncbi:MAG: hypothetical protein U0T84_14060 [Chitinophagales bacterium]